MRRPTRFGVHLGQQNITIQELRGLWRRCDGAFDQISIWDHFYEAPYKTGESPTYEAVSLLAALALDTSVSRIGCLVFSPTYRHPSVLAKALTTIDHLSGGRLFVGLGTGWHQEEHEAFGLVLPTVREREDRLEEAIQIMRTMFDNQVSTWQGRYFQVQEIRNVPSPVQAHIPIVVGGGGERRTLVTAAKLASGSNQGYLSPSDFRRKGELLHELCERFDRDPATLEHSVTLHFATPAGMGKASGDRTDAASHELSKDPAPHLSPRLDGSLFGKPSHMIDRIGEYIEAGADLVSIALRPPVDYEALQAYTEDVIPAFRGTDVL